MSVPRWEKLKSLVDLQWLLWFVCNDDDIFCSFLHRTVEGLAKHFYYMLLIQGTWPISSN